MPIHHCFVNRLLIMWAFVLACACQAPEAYIVQLGVAMPLTQSQIDLIEVSATQVGSTVRATPDADGWVHLQILAGVEARLQATIFSLEANTWLSFEGTHIFVPEPGHNRVEMEPQAVALREGRIIPVLAKPDGTTAVWTRPDLPISVREHATGLSNNPARDPFLANHQIRVPAGRAFTFTLARAGQTFSLDLDATAELDDLFLWAGDAPTLPATTTLSTQHPFIDLETALGIDETFPIECAVGNDCEAPLEWVACDPLTLEKLVGEERAQVMVRYQHVLDLSCSMIFVDVDTTAPFATLVFDPPLVSEDSPPTFVEVRLIPSEGLQPESLELTALDKSGGSYACSGPFVKEVLGDGSPPHYVCELDVSGWDISRGNISVSVDGSDKAGNAFLEPPTAVLTTVSSTAASGLLVLGVHTFPPLPNARGRELFLGVDIVNFTGAGLCHVDISSLQIDDPDGALFIQLAPPYEGTPLVTRLPASTAGAPVVDTLWLPLDLPQGDAEPGDYPVRVQVQAWTAVDPTCQELIDSVSSGQANDFWITLASPPIKWMGEAPLGLGVSTWGRGSNASIIPPLLGGSDPSGLSYLYASSDPVVSVSKGEVTALRGLAPGTAELRITDPHDNSEAAVQVEVSPPPELLVLQQTRLVRISPTASETFILDAAIGQPKKVLWEPMRDIIIVVGHQGVQRLPSSLENRIEAPCEASSVLDATISAPTPDRRPDVALLVKGSDGTSKHCEIVLDDWGSTREFLLDTASFCPNSNIIMADPQSGTFTLLGTDCATRYRVGDGGPSDVHREIIPQGFGQAARAAALDPYGNYAAAIFDDPSTPEDERAGGWHLGAALTQLGEYQLYEATAGEMPLAVLDVVIDPARGTPIVSVLSDIMGRPMARLFRFEERASAFAPPTASTTSNLSGQAWSHIALDAGHRVLYVVDSTSSPSVHVSDAELWLDPSLAPVVPLSTREPVTDMIVAGPQLVGLEPRIARPGNVVVAYGTGFAGESRDQAYVGSVPAEVLNSSTTAVVFRVPRDFDAKNEQLVSWPTHSANVTIRSHGRMSGPGTDPLNILPRQPAHKLDQYASSAYPCEEPAGCSKPKLLEGFSSIIALREGGNGAGIVSFVPYGGTAYPHTNIWPQAGALSINRRRLIVHHSQPSAGFSEIWLPEMPVDTIWETSHDLGELLSSPLGRMAGDPVGRYLAVDSAGQPQLLWAPTATLADPLPVGPQTSVTDLVFTPDGDTLVVAAGDGSFAGFALEPPFTVLTSQGDIQDCPAGTPTLLGMWPHTRAVPQVSALLVYPPGDTLAIVSIWRDGNTLRWECRSHGPAKDGTPVLASLSPYGDVLGVVSDDGNQGHLRLLDPEDLSHELDYLYLGQNLTHALLVGFGFDASSTPQVVLVTPDNVLFYGVSAVRRGG